MNDVFYFFRQSALRSDLIRNEHADPGARYLLYGMDHLNRQGLSGAHNLPLTGPAQSPQGRPAHWLAFLIQKAGGLSGDFQTVFTHRRQANHYAVIFSTVDTVGVPLALVNRFGLIRPPLVYASVGLPERIARIKSGFLSHFYRKAYRRIPRFIAYGWEEALWIRRWLTLPDDDPRVSFIPFGVDEIYFTPRPETAPSVDVLSIGADPQRDFKLLLGIASRHPELSFRLIVDTDRAAELGTVPTNVEIRINVPFPEIRDHLAAAKVVALPVHENTYSAGTTTLLQAMAMARPVVVSQTGAIRNGYHLKDGDNCRLVPPGNDAAFETALLDSLRNPASASMGLSARQTVEQYLTWQHYETALFNALKSAGRIT